MKIVSSYAVAIKQQKRIFDQTVGIYREAVSHLVRYADEWYEHWKDLGALGKVNFVERLVHGTKKNKPHYAFDLDFPKFPSYYRRAAIQKAIAIVSSYRANYANWETGGKHGKPPRLAYDHYAMPALYHKGSFLFTGEYEAAIKVFMRGDWLWLSVRLDKGDVDYIRRRMAGAKMSAPTLEKRRKKYELRFSFEESAVLTMDKDIVVGCDLGVTNAVTMCAMRPDGTVLAREFLSLAREEDHLRRAVGYIKKAQQGGSYKTPRLWAYAKGVGQDISSKTAEAIIRFAKAQGADVIVFEHLDFRGRKKRGARSKRQRLHLWRKMEVQRIVELHAHREGMRVSHVNAWNTSKLAYDGSGKVVRGREAGLPHSMCKFQNGKIYNADLNAAYNIAARFHIRERLKSLPVTARLAVEAKVPSVAKRLSCGLSDLISLCAVIASL